MKIGKASSNVSTVLPDYRISGRNFYRKSSADSSKHGRLLHNLYQRLFSSIVRKRKIEARGRRESSKENPLPSLPSFVTC